MEVKSSYLGTMIGLATVAFGLIAAGAWNKFISDIIALFLKDVYKRQQKRLISVGRGTGPLTKAPVRLAVSTIRSAD